MKELIKKKFKVEKDIKKELEEIKDILGSSLPDSIKFDSIKAIFNELAEEIVEQKINTMLEDRTGLLGPQFAEEFIEREISAARRYKRPFTVALLDIDFLKYINDHFGHVKGTKVIMEVAEIIKDKVRKDDIISRYGGDEFLVIFPHTDISKAEMALNRVKKAVSELLIEGEIRVSLSIGFHEYAGEKPLSAEEFIRQVDEALYENKKSRINLNLC
ncbi:MAG: GGDEF domain-containing protein [Patescibacteria group bacterium]|nr:GGDEF domain-containing protein [Patescibacteria group bacterium]